MTTFIPVITFVPDDVIDSDKLNMYLRDNMNALFPYLAAGDIAFATGPDELGKVSIGSENTFLSVINGIPAWAPLVMARRGGLNSDWNYPGNTNYTPANTVIQTGCITWTGTAAATGNIWADFPIAYTKSPIVFATANGSPYTAIATSGTLTRAYLMWKTVDSSTITSLNINWLALGEI